MNAPRSTVETERRPPVGTPCIPTRVSNTPLRVKWRSRGDKRRAGRADAKIAYVVRALGSAWDKMVFTFQDFLYFSGRLDIELAHVGSETGADDTLSGTMVSMLGGKSVAIVNLAETCEMVIPKKQELSRLLLFALAKACLDRIPIVEERLMAGRRPPALAKIQPHEFEMVMRVSVLSLRSVLENPELDMEERVCLAPCTLELRLRERNNDVAREGR